jgi:hypothetical protein
MQDVKLVSDKLNDCNKVVMDAIYLMGFSAACYAILCGRGTDAEMSPQSHAHCALRYSAYVLQHVSLNWFNLRSIVPACMDNRWRNYLSTFEW